MSEETWHAARLIPTSGINGADEQERRATSALLAVMSSVREFGLALTKRFGALSGTIDTFIEVPFDLGERKVFPDGLVRVRRGTYEWTALVEVKTVTNALIKAQLEDYLDVARTEGFDALITVSNELAPLPGLHPTAVDRRKLKKVQLHHISWTEVTTAAVMQKVHRGVADPDQAWILGELIRYLEHPRSGAMGFDDMGDDWVTVRNAVDAGTLRPTDKGAPRVASRWDQLIRFACLVHGQRLGVEVQPALPRREAADPTVANQVLVENLTRNGLLQRDIRIPGGVAPLTLAADLRAQRVMCSLTIDAPKEGRPLTRINWLLRQLKEAPDTLRIDTFVFNGRAVATSELLRDVRSDPSILIGDPKRELRAFRLVQAAPMGTKRGEGRGSFIGSVLGVLDDFYSSTVERLRPWAPSAPRSRPVPGAVEQEAVEQDVPRSLVSTAASSQDGPGAGRTAARPEPPPAPSISPEEHPAPASSPVIRPWGGNEDRLSEAPTP
ncbi:MAG TPA: hypothetical protein VEW93_00960 [Acidimicrobiales bacterium]|nr:hypothetical protein [Acidimicrobiales bacterium]